MQRTAILPPIPRLHPQLRTLAEAVLADPRSTPDHILIFADAVDEAAQDYALSDRPFAAACVDPTRALARVLRDLARPIC